MMPMTLAIALIMAATEEVRYLRLLPDRTEPECSFIREDGEGGWKITSVTGRAGKTLTVTARYDAANILLEASAVAEDGAAKPAVRVAVKEGKARVVRDDGTMQELDAPPGVIVTSAPDWTDTFLLCQRYDRKKGGKQEFPGLWIHPLLPAQRLTFSIEHVGADVICYEGKPVTLDRHEIRIRNNSAYAAWTDREGKLIKLTTLPPRAKGGLSLVRSGYETSAAALRPAER
jgi:hypothetical protein